MKKLFFITLTAITFQFASAQEKEENQFKRFYVNTGVSSNSVLFDTSIAYNAGLEYKFKDETSIGVNFLHREYGKNYYGKPTDTGINFTFNYDWSEKLGLNTSKFDLYTGVNLGITSSKRPYLYTLGAENSGVYLQEQRSTTYTDKDLGGQIGIRYFFTKNIGLNVEANQINGVSGIKLGTTIRF